MDAFQVPVVMGWAKTIFPVSEFPITRDCLEVEAMVGVPYRVRAPDMEADPELEREVTEVGPRVVVAAFRVLKLAFPEELI